MPYNATSSLNSSDYARKIAWELMKSGMSGEPVQHWTQGAARMAHALMGGLELRRGDERDAEYGKSQLGLPGLSQSPGAGSGASMPSMPSSNAQPGGSPVAASLGQPRIAITPPESQGNPRSFGRSTDDTVVANADPARMSADSMTGMLGSTMRNPQQKAMLLDYMQTGGENLTRQQRAWCADFVNSARAQQGLATGNPMAESLRNVGDPRELGQERKGDVAVWPNKPGQNRAPHVGVVSGFDPNGNMRVVHGNSNNAVAEGSFRPGFLDIRSGDRPGGMPPTAMQQQPMQQPPMQQFAGITPTPDSTGGALQAPRVQGQQFAQAQQPMQQPPQNHQLSGRPQQNIPQPTQQRQRITIPPEDAAFLRREFLSGDPRRIAAARAEYDRMAKPTDQWVPHNLPNGELAQRNMTTGEIKTAGTQNKDLQTVEEALKNPTKFGFTGHNDPRLIQAIQHRLAGLQQEAGESKQSQVMGEYHGKLYGTISDSARKASTALGTYRAMESLMEQPGFRSGTGAAFETTIRRAITALGGDPKAAQPNEAFRQLSNKVIFDTLGSLGNQISNADRQFIENAFPNLGSTPEGNRLMIKILSRTSERQAEIGRMARSYKGGKLDPEFESKMDEYAAKNPLFSEKEMLEIIGHSGGAGGTAAPDAQGWITLPNGSRIREIK